MGMMEKQNNIEFEYNGHKVVVSNADGSNDGYYWDKTFFIIVDKIPYIMFEVGSGSGWIPNSNTLKQVSFEYLKDRKEENTDSSYNDVSISDFNQSLFELLFDFMIESNASEVNQDDDYELHVIESEDKKQNEI